MSTDLNFTEWLEKKAVVAGQPERARRRGEYISALDRLYEQIIAWLRESDPKGLLSVERLEIDRSEPNLGRYTAPYLKIGLGDVSAKVLPMGLDIRGSYADRSGVELKYEGRADISDGLRRHVLYRVISEGAETWITVPDRGPVRRLDRPELEAILWDLWS